MTVIGARLERVIREIDQTLDQPLNMNLLADKAAYSRFHFQRQFSALMGVGVADYQRLMRLKRAGHQLAYRPEQSVTDIAFEAAYQNLESFSRAFRRAFGQSPTEFREAPDWSTWHLAYDPLTDQKGKLMPGDAFEQEKLRLTRFPETQVAVLEHRGPQTGLTASAQQFIAWRRAYGLPPSRHATFNIVYDDPKVTPPEEFRFDFCCAVSKPVAENGYGIVIKTLPGGRCAVLRHTGSLDFAEPAIRSLYRDWLPGSGEELRDFPLFVQRLSFYPDVPEHEAETEIFLPLR
eukprot:g1385.t1